MHLTTPDLYAGAYRDDTDRALWALSVCGRTELVKNLTLRPEHATCPDCDLAAQAAAPSPAPTTVTAASNPITSWRHAADILGLHEDTLRAHRKRHHASLTKPWWASADDVHTWYRDLTRPTTTARRSPRRSKPRSSSSVKGTTLADLRAERRRK